jgi:hypothetical protein
MAQIETVKEFAARWKMSTYTVLAKIRHKLPLPGGARVENITSGTTRPRYRIVSESAE